MKYQQVVYKYLSGVCPADNIAGMCNKLTQEEGYEVLHIESVAQLAAQSTDIISSEQRMQVVPLSCVVGRKAVGFIEIDLPQVVDAKDSNNTP